MGRDRETRLEEAIEEEELSPGVSPGKLTLSSRLAAVVPIQMLRSRIASLTGAPVAPAERVAPTWSDATPSDPQSGFALSLGVDLDSLGVQAKGAPSGTDIHAAAAHGVSGSGGSLPYLDRIQQSFGRHDIGGVRAHVGGAAGEASRAMSAEAYAVGENVAFRGQPDLHTAAHEAAHVVQQRKGVSLKGGVGEVGDAYERHADAVADQVVRGQNAEPLLDQMAGGGAAVQAKAVQRLDSRDVVGNTLSATGTNSVDREGRTTGELDDRSERRVYERIAELRGRDPVQAGEEFAAMEPDEREAALEREVTWFQQSQQGSGLVDQIRADNDVRREDGSSFYNPPSSGRRSSYTAPRAGYEEGQVHLNDATMQALANAWPQRLFGRLMNEEQAYEVLRRMVLGRGMPFNPEGVNVVGMRAYQGGERHDNSEETIFTRQNRYDDTTFILSMQDGRRSVQQSRATVDPGQSRTAFQVAADQQWDYRGNTRGQTAKYDRPMFSLDNPQEVRRGRYWQQHPELVEAAAGRRGGSGRLIRHQGGRTGFDRNAAGAANRVSAVHSGGGGGATGEIARGDSTGCSVVHGAWFANFNESLRRAGGGGDQARFTYTLIDPRTFRQIELRQILDSVVPQQQEAQPQERTRPGEEPTRRLRYEYAPPATPYEEPVQPALRGSRLEGSSDQIHQLAASGLSGSGGQLPHLDVIQRAFGHHDVSGVVAHVGGAAADATSGIGALAYASGGQVAFGSQPDLHTAAHEAAHVVQQRGGVSLKSGVGEAGDAYERHADAVADKVVRNESAEALLDTMAHRGSAGGSAVQMSWGDADDEACVALQEFIDRAPRHTLELTYRSWNRAARRGRRGTAVELETDGEAVSVPRADARQAVRAAQARLTAMREGAGEEAHAGEGGAASGDDPYNFPGHLHSNQRGYAYGGGRKPHTRQRLTEVAAYFRDQGYEDYAVGTETFKRTMEREGYISAINTWDGQIFTWGTGFAARQGMFPAVWAQLDPSVKAAIVALAPERVSTSGVQLDGIRTDMRTMGAFVRVSEAPEHFDKVLHAQLRTFLVHTMGLSAQPIQGLHLPIGDGDQLYLSTRLAHHRSSLWHFGPDTRAALALTGGASPPDDTEYLAACIHLKTQHAIERGGGEGPDGRRIQTRWFDEVGKWRTRIGQWKAGRSGHDSHEVVITSRTQHLCPSLVSPSSPYFQSVSSIDEIPANHLVAVEGATNIENRTSQWLRAPTAEKFYDMGPVELAALGLAAGGAAGGAEPEGGERAE